MPHPDLILSILQTTATYYTLTRKMIQEACVPCDSADGRLTRRLLQQLVDQLLLSRTRMEVTNPTAGQPAPVYYPARGGLDYLVCATKQDHWLSCCTATPTWQHLLHYVDVARFHIALDRAAALHPGVTIRFFGEWDVVNPNARGPEKYRLFTLLQEQPKRIVFAPDAGFLLNVHDIVKRAYYVEIDRATSSLPQVVHSKSPGVAEMARQRAHVRHFPDTTMPDSFRVLLVTLTGGRRDALARLMKPMPASDCWGFAAWEDLQGDWIGKPIWHRCNGAPGPLVNLEASALTQEPVCRNSPESVRRGQS